MSLNEKISRDDILLPNVILCNRVFVPAQRFDGREGTAEPARAKLPNVQSNNDNGEFGDNLVDIKCGSVFPLFVSS